MFSNLEVFWGALKYGPIGLAAIATVLAAYLLWDVLKLPQVSKSKRRIFFGFMFFCMGLFIIAIGANVLDNLLFKADRRVENVRQYISRLDENEMQKFTALTGTIPGESEEQRRNRIINTVPQMVPTMCRLVVQISREFDVDAVKCKEVLRRSSNS